MKYLLFFEDGEVQISNDLSDDDIKPCSWPSIVRILENETGGARFEKLNYDGSWVDLENK